MLSLLVALLLPPAPVDLNGPGICARCHPAITRQWQASSHARSSLDNPWYLGSLRRIAAERPDQLAFCGRCHDPALLAVDALHPEATGPEATAGIGCSLCHSLQAHPTAVNGEYTLDGSPIPVQGPAHGARVRWPAEGRAERCAVCHEVRLTEDLTKAHWQMGQSDHRPWRDGPWGGAGLDVVLSPAKGPQDCVDCHLPKVAVEASERGRDAAGEVRDHRFVGGHVALGRLRGDEEAEAAAVASLQGAIALDLGVARSGYVDVVLRNVGVGHPFPGGTQDAKQVWLELTAWDGDGAVVARRGILDVDGQIPHDTWRIGAQPVDGAGRALRGRAVWDQRGVVANTRLLPGAPRVARFAVPEAARRLRVRLRFRRFNPLDTALLCDPGAPAACHAPPITDLVDLSAVLPLAAERPWKALLAHGLGLAAGLPEHVADAGPLIEAAAQAAPAGAVEIALARARHAAVQGRTDDGVALLAGVEDPRARWIEANLLARAFRHGPARAAAERLVAAVPDDRRALILTARLRGLTGDHAGALAAADRALVQTPDDAEALYQRALALRALGAPGFEAAEALWLRHRRRDELDWSLRDLARRLAPGDVRLFSPTGPD